MRNYSTNHTYWQIALVAQVPGVSEVMRGFLGGTQGNSGELRGTLTTLLPNQVVWLHLRFLLGQTLQELLVGLG